MDVIGAYLDTMFAPYPQTQRLLEAKNELRQMMEDAYTAALAAGRSENEAVGQVITEFGNLDELAPVLGIASELHPGSAAATGVSGAPAADAGSAAAAGTAPAAGFAATAGAAPAPAARVFPPVALEEAQSYAEATRRAQPLLAIAAAIFVISPAALIGLAVFSDNPAFALDEGVAVFIGLAALLVLVLIGVGLILRREALLAPYRRLREGRFEPDPAVSAWAEARRLQQAPRRSAVLIVAVALWVLAALPTIASGLFEREGMVWGEQLPGIGVPLTLLMVALGLLVFLPTIWAEGVAQQLERGRGVAEGEDAEEAAYPRPVRAILAVYWPLMVAIYLAWSFIGSAWGISWVLWPVAGLVFAALSALGRALRQDRPRI